MDLTHEIQHRNFSIDEQRLIYHKYPLSPHFQHSCPRCGWKHPRQKPCPHCADTSEFDTATRECAREVPEPLAEIEDIDFEDEIVYYSILLGKELWIQEPLDEDNEGDDDENSKSY